MAHALSSFQPSDFRVGDRIRVDPDPSLGIDGGSGTVTVVLPTGVGVKWDHGGAHPIMKEDADRYGLRVHKMSKSGSVRYYSKLGWVRG